MDWQSPTATVREATASSAAVSPSTTSNATLTLAQIEAAIDPAVVNITVTIGSSGIAKGTGMVISATGEILTNNHVISGATNITVEFGGTGRTYPASLVGYDVTADIAVLQITNVSGLTTIRAASSSALSASDPIFVIGNALGQGGTPDAVQGVVTNVNQTITASDQSGSNAETLNGLIEVSAAVQSGDSGGATANAAGQVIGMTTAASAGGLRPMSTGATTIAYAIPIERALGIARQIESGEGSATVHIGRHGLLGVEVQGTFASGAQVVAVQPGSAAAEAGIAAGDAITSVGGTGISSTSDLNDAMNATHVGDQLALGWQDAAGQAHRTTVTLTTGVA